METLVLQLQSSDLKSKLAAIDTLTSKFSRGVESIGEIQANRSSIYSQPATFL